MMQTGMRTGMQRFLIVAAAILMVSGITSSTIVVEGATDTTFTRRPYCGVKSMDVAYDKNARVLVSYLTSEIVRVRWPRQGGSKRYSLNYPSRGSGSVTGSIACHERFNNVRCMICVRRARDMIKDQCGAVVEATVELGDCSLWFRKIV